MGFDEQAVGAGGDGGDEEILAAPIRLEAEVNGAVIAPENRETC